MASKLSQAFVALNGVGRVVNGSSHGPLLSISASCTSNQEEYQKHKTKNDLMIDNIQVIAKVQKLGPLTGSLRKPLPTLYILFLRCNAAGIFHETRTRDLCKRGNSLRTFPAKSQALVIISSKFADDRGMEAAAVGGERIQMRLGVMVGMKGCDVRQLQSFPPPTRRYRYITPGSLHHIIMTLHYAMQCVCVHTILNGRPHGYDSLHLG